MPQKTARSFQHCRGSKKDVILGKKRRRRNSPYHSSFLLRPQSPHNSTAGAAAKNYDKTTQVILQAVFHKNICQCGHTHAILPDHIVPYSTYSLPFILRVLGEYFLGLRGVEQLCRRYAISASMLYQWKALFLEHKAVWLGVVRDLEITPAGFIRRLLALPRYSSDFGKPFWRKAARSFLQGRREAACFRRAVF